MSSEDSCDGLYVKDTDPKLFCRHTHKVLKRKFFNKTNMAACKSPYDFGELLRKAHWHYVDVIHKADPDKNKNKSPRLFVSHCFQAFSLLMLYYKDRTRIQELYCQVKIATPSFGAILLNPSMTKILLVRQYICKRWGFPGGKIEPNESPRSCVIRETQEETGVIRLGPRLTNSFIKMSTDYRHGGGYFIAVNVSEYEVRYTKTHDEIIEKKWFAIQEIREMMMPEYKGFEDNEIEELGPVPIAIPFVEKFISDYRNPTKPIPTFRVSLNHWSLMPTPAPPKFKYSCILLIITELEYESYEESKK